MIDERELWACANLLLKQHGIGAAPYAETRAVELAAHGELAGYKVFVQIADRIRQLECRHSSRPVH